MYNINILDNRIELSNIDFNIKHTCDCGQCFRFVPYENGYLGLAYQKVIYIEPSENGVVFHCSKAEFNTLWKNYFDLDTDYSLIAQALPNDSFTSAAVEFGRGLRILRQEPWEALCSFIISQCNNIPRIQGIIDRLCRLYGNEILWNGQSMYTFPSAQKLAYLEVEDLAPLRCGYRAPYIISAAKAVAQNSRFFDELVSYVYLIS